MAYEPIADEVIPLFALWELAAAQSANPRVALSAPLDPPSIEEATALLPRLRGINEEMEENDVDWHARPIGNRDQAAMGQLWEEWRDDKLELWNVYKEVWSSGSS